MVFHPIKHIDGSSSKLDVILHILVGIVTVIAGVILIKLVMLLNEDFVDFDSSYLTLFT